MADGRESIAEKELRSLTSTDLLSVTEIGGNSLTRFSTTTSEPRRPSQFDKPTIQEELDRTIARHKQQLEQDSQLDRGLSLISESVHGSSSSLENLERLKEQAAREGKALSTRTDLDIRLAIEQDREAMSTRSDINLYGTGMLTMAGLFLQGKKGAMLTAGSYAVSSMKVNDSGQLQTADALIGAGRGLATRGLFGALAKAPIDVPARALGMGAVSRFMETGANRRTYIDQKTGEVDLVGGIVQTARSTGDLTAAGTDLFLFGVGSLGMRNQTVRDAVMKTPATQIVSSVGVFGFSAGSVEEAKRQWREGESLNVGRIIERGALKGSTDMVAALPGALLRKSPGRGLNLFERTEPKVTGGALAGQTIAKINRQFAGAQSRDFQIVGGDIAALNMVAQSKNAHAMLKVRELSPKGQPIGDAKSMLVQHVEPGHPLKVGLAAKADLIACCNATWLGPFKGKHILPESNGQVGMKRSGDRLHFSQYEPLNQSSVATAGGMSEALLGKPIPGMPPRPAPGLVSDLLRAEHTSNIMRVKRPLWAIADEMKHFKIPAKMVRDGGGDAITIELMDGRMLKIHDKPSRRTGEPLWVPEWGSRIVQTRNGPVGIDARVLTEPFQIEVLNNPVLYYIQERARTPVSIKDTRRFNDMLEMDGRYQFWDKDFSSHGASQLGWVPAGPGKQRLVTFDYDAVRPPHEVPRGKSDDGSGAGAGHWLDRYRGNIEW